MGVYCDNQNKPREALAQDHVLHLKRSQYRAFELRWRSVDSGKELGVGYTGMRVHHRHGDHRRINLEITKLGAWALRNSWQSEESVVTGAAH